MYIKSIKKFLRLTAPILLVFITSSLSHALSNRVTDFKALPTEISNEIGLSWTYPGPNQLNSNSKYFVQYSTWAEIVWSTSNAQICISTGLVESGANQSYSINGLDYGISSYYFRLWTYDNSDNSISNISNTAIIPFGWQVNQTITEGGVSDISCADYNKDGYLDFAIAGNGQVSIYKNKKDGTFQKAYSFKVDGLIRAVKWGDYDNDGLPDLAVGTQLFNNNNAHNYVFHNNGNDTFSLVWVSSESDPTYDICWGDFNNDGLLDLAVANAGTVPNRIYQNKGNGTFDLAYNISKSYESYCMDVRDYNNDGFLDIVCTGPNSSVLVYKNNGNDTFSLVWSSNEREYGWDIKWGDYNNDGLADIVVANSGYPDHLYRNNGDNTFTLVWSSQDSDQNTGVDWGDYNNDGLLDLVFSKSYASDCIYKNNGNNTFTRVWTAPQAQSYSGDASWGDFNNDGLLDFVTASHIISGYPLRIYKQMAQNTGLSLPLEPSNFKGRATAMDSITGTDSIQWNWDPVASATYYKIYNADTGQLLSTVQGNKNTSWTETNLNTNARYSHYVKAGNDAGLSDSSNISSVYTVACMPNVGNESSLDHITQTGVSLHWYPDRNPSGTNYLVRFSTTNEFESYISSITTATAMRFEKLSANKEYIIDVSAVNGDNIPSDPLPLGDIYTLCYPPLPGNPVFYDVTKDGIGVQWLTNGNPEGTYYRMEFSTSSDFSNLDYAGNNDLTHIGRSAGPNTLYYFRVFAINNDACPTDYVFLGSTATLANIPISSDVTNVTESSITANWLSNNNPLYTQYIVETSTDSSFGTVSSTMTTSTNATFTGLMPSTVHYFHVKAVNDCGVNTSWVVLPSTVTLTNLITAPANFSGVTVSTGSIQWSWNVSDGAKYYNVYNSTNATLMGSTAGCGLLEIGLNSNTLYHGYVIACNKAGLSEPSNISEIYTLAEQPEINKFVVVSTNSIILNWLGGNNPVYTKYVCELSPDSNFLTYQSKETQNLSAEFSGLNQDTKYYLRVKAVNETGIESPYSLAIATKTLCLVPNAPITISGKPISSSSILWQWSAQGLEDTVQGYRLYSSGNMCIANLTKDTTCWLQEGLNANSKYDCIIKSFNSAGESSGSSVSCVTLANNPSNLSVDLDKISKHHVFLSWEGNGATTFRIDLSNDGINWNTAATNLTLSDSNKYNLHGLKPSTTYYFAVWGFNRIGIITVSSSTTSPIVTEGLPNDVKIITSKSDETKEINNNLGDVCIKVPKKSLPDEFSESYILIEKENKLNFSQALIQAADNTSQNNILAINDSIIEIMLYSINGKLYDSAIYGNFSNPVELILGYSDNNNDGITDNNLKADTLKIFTFNEKTLKWEIVPGEQIVDTNNKTVTVKIWHFSKFALASGNIPENTLDNVKVYPNPYKPDSGTIFDNSLLGEGIVFDKLTGKAKIRIFNIAGELVAECDENDQDGRYLWNTRNQSGNKVASGVYIFIITNPDDSSQKSKGKFSIIR